MTFNKRRLPVATYAAALLRQLRRYHPGPARVRIDDDDVVTGHFYLVVASNIALYARYFKLAHDARLDDGLLDMILINAEQVPHFFVCILKLLMLPHTRDPRIIVRQARRLQIETDTPQPLHLDGDPVGTTPLDAVILPKRLHIYLDRRRAAPRLLAPP